jgi:protein gp37
LKKGRLKDAQRYQDLERSHDSAMLVVKELNKSFSKQDFVFVEDMGDLFGSWIPVPWIYNVMEVIEKFPLTKFLLLTKNPARMLEYKFPDNVLCGATIETTESTRAWSFAPAPQNRYTSMRLLPHEHKMICIEPVINFNLEKFFQWLTWIPNLELVVIGCFETARS